MDMNQHTMIEQTINKRPLLIMVRPSSMIYFKLLRDNHLSGSVLTLLQPSVQGLENMANLIKTTAKLRRQEETGCD